VKDSVDKKTEMKQEVKLATGCRVKILNGKTNYKN